MTKILVVDDAVHIRSLLQKMLERQGYQVMTVPSAEQAMDIIFRELLDLVILDVNLAGESGLVVLKKIRAKSPRLPVVMYSGAITPDIESAARSAGATEVLRKDIGIPLLVKQIAKIVQAQTSTGFATNKEGAILVVDDQESIRQLLKKFFTEKGFQVLEAKNGYEAVQTVRSQKVAAVLLDLEMPIMGGLETLPKLLEVNPKLGVVMVTGIGDMEKVSEAMELGAYGYVLKPFDFLYLELVVLSRLTIAVGS